MSNPSQINDEKGYDAHTPALHYHFSIKEMEFNFQWIAGSISTGGCELGEAFLTTLHDQGLN